MAALRVAVVGATGWIGGHVTRVALERGHHVTGVSRSGSVEGASASAAADIVDAAALKDAFAGHDAVVSAYRAEDPGQMPAAARSLIGAARDAGVGRVVWTGSTAVLHVPGGGGALVDLPQFPEEWKPAGLAHRDSLQVFRDEGEGIDWTYVAPPRTIEEGERAGAYRVQEDEFLVDESGESRISVQDFAAAIVDLVERGEHGGKCVTVAY